MSKPTKEERKRLRQQAEESIRNQETFVTIISPKATVEVASPKAILAEAAKNGVRLNHCPIDHVTHAFGVPDEIDVFSVALGYGSLDEETIALASDSEWLVDDPRMVAVGLPTITFRGKVQMDPVIDFLGMTLIRVLGRVAHGVLMSGPGGTVNDDWLSWSLDYMDQDMFEVTRVYDDSCPDFKQLIERFPQLRIDLATDSTTSKKPWWRVW